MAATFPPLSALCVELLETMKRLSRHESQLRLDAEQQEYEEFKELQIKVDHGFERLLDSVKHDNKLIS